MKRSVAQKTDRVGSLYILLLWTKSYWLVKVYKCSLSEKNLIHFIYVWTAIRFPIGCGEVSNGLCREKTDQYVKSRIYFSKNRVRREMTYPAHSLPCVLLLFLLGCSKENYLIDHFSHKDFLFFTVNDKSANLKNICED